MLGAPMQVKAASVTHVSADAHKMPMSAPIECNKNGCVEQHGTCETHCVSPSTQGERSVGTLTSHEESMHFSGGSFWEIAQHKEDGIFLHRSEERAPPALLLLRSVVKRE